MQSVNSWGELLRGKTFWCPGSLIRSSNGVRALSMISEEWFYLSYVFSGWIRCLNWSMAQWGTQVTYKCAVVLASSEWKRRFSLEIIKRKQYFLDATPGIRAVHGYIRGWELCNVWTISTITIMTSRIKHWHMATCIRGLRNSAVTFKIPTTLWVWMVGAYKSEKLEMKYEFWQFNIWHTNIDPDPAQQINVYFKTSFSFSATNCSKESCEELLFVWFCISFVFAMDKVVFHPQPLGYKLSWANYLQGN